MLSLLGILLAIKEGIYYINLLHKLIIQLYYANFRLPFCHLAFRFFSLFFFLSFFFPHKCCELF